MACFLKRSYTFLLQRRSLLRCPCHQGIQSKNVSNSQVFQNKKISESEMVQGLESNPYFEKYAKKITNLKKIDESAFIDRLNEVKEKKYPKSPMLPSNNSNASTFPPHPTDISSRMGKQSSYTQVKSLDSVMKTELLQNLPAQEISKLWIDYHLDKNFVCATIDAEIYEKILEIATECPTFLYPVLRKEGYEFIVGQFSGQSYFFTQLINYQAYKEESPVCLTLTHFTELKTNKSIVLMRGEYDDKILSVVEAQFLANQVQLYYGQADPERKRLLYLFNKEPSKFKHKDVIDNLEKL